MKPFEWLYEGMRPLLLPDVLANNWGIPLALATLYACVGLRLGVSLVPQKLRQAPEGDPVIPYLLYSALIFSLMC